ncbi:hypothetical protein XENTR_v10005506 [Xenopus tropicalis]|nr:hypothetical protein XENTR_v10005506 [Xenopus tropicalis]
MKRKAQLEGRWNFRRETEVGSCCQMPVECLDGGCLWAEEGEDKWCVSCLPRASDITDAPIMMQCQGAW